MADKVIPTLSTSISVPTPKNLSILKHPVVTSSLQPDFIKSCPNNIRTATFSLSSFQFLRPQPNCNVSHPIMLAITKSTEDTQFFPNRQDDTSSEKECRVLMRHMAGQQSTLISKTTNCTKKLEALLNEDPSKFIELCRKALAEIRSHQLNLEGRLPIRSESQEGPTIGVQFQPKLANTHYDKLVPVLAKAGSEISLMEDSPEVNKKIISVFGRKFFDAVLDPEEILEGCASSRAHKRALKKGTGNEYDADKICLIARCLAWLISTPRDLSLEEFKKFEAEKLKKTETGLDTSCFRYFKETILVKYGCERRRSLAREMETKSSEIPIKRERRD